MKKTGAKGAVNSKTNNEEKKNERINTKETSNSPKATEGKAIKSQSQQKSLNQKNNKLKEKLPSKNASKTEFKANVKTISKKSEEERLKELKRDEQYRRLEAYINESGLNLAFNIIFAELVAKQILPDNFFTYTAMRLKQIGKEIEGMKTKIPMYIEKPSESNNANEKTELETGEIIQKETEDVFLTGTKGKNQIEASKDNKGDGKQFGVKPNEDLKKVDVKSKENVKQTGKNKEKAQPMEVKETQQLEDKFKKKQLEVKAKDNLKQNDLKTNETSKQLEAKSKENSRQLEAKNKETQKPPVAQKEITKQPEKKQDEPKAIAKNKNTKK